MARARVRRSAGRSRRRRRSCSQPCSAPPAHFAHTPCLGCRRRTCRGGAMYNLLQFLHVTAAIVWIGSGIGLVALFAVLGRAGEHETLMATSRHVEKLGKGLFGPAAMGTLIFGILTVLSAE